MNAPRRASRRVKELGQNFLRDPNILGVIARMSELSLDDVVLEVGGGEGMLSAYLAPRVHWLHVVELDERLRQALEARLSAASNVTLWWGDAMSLDLACMRPAPTKLVANLPYAVAASVLLRTIDELPSLHLWVAMVQREVGERLAAAPGGRDYGASSVLAQLAVEVKVARAVSRTVFAPVPNVDSVLLEMRRVATGVTPDVRRLVRGAFAHRRKTLAGSLALARVGPSRERVREALVTLGHSADARAERLTPPEFVALARALRI